VILLFEVVGNESIPPAHIAATCVKVGVVRGLTVTVIVAVDAH
jgi:aspartate-semialdehyde dehydrogenase